ncbi:MAG: MFS transporter [Clostridia bacterium]|nr:MFS transporter [Clostridia bacterium]
MKLNYRRTTLIGLAFLSISAFWQMYDTIIPLILRDTFSIGDSASGIIMAMDNVLAVFLLPIFGKLSDRCGTPIGKRMPFIVCGTALAVIFMLLMSAANVPGRFTMFIVLLGLTLISMGTYRSPAVALMPDVTPKPLRSKANAVINLMGALGGVYSLLVIRVLTAGGSTNYTPIFIAVAALMAVAVVLLLAFVRENKLRALVPTETAEAASTGGKLPPEMKRSLILILCSVSLWFMGYNAVTTAYSKYFTRMWGDLSGAASCLMIATVGAVVSYIPVGIISTKIGRKRMIMIGVVVLASSFGIAAFVRVFTPLVYVLFVIIGFAWASINVNSYPMVVEISRGGDVGKYTGYYYTFSMAAQILTPVLSGWLLEHVGYHTLFPYAFVMVGAAFFTMLFVRHGDSKPAQPKSALEHFDVED